MVTIRRSNSAILPPFSFGFKSQKYIVCLLEVDPCLNGFFTQGSKQVTKVMSLGKTLVEKHGVVPIHMGLVVQA